MTQTGQLGIRISWVTLKESIDLSPSKIDWVGTSQLGVQDVFKQASREFCCSQPRNPPFDTTGVWYNPKPYALVTYRNEPFCLNLVDCGGS